jgi:hypothetical protein
MSPGDDHLPRQEFGRSRSYVATATCMCAVETGQPSRSDSVRFLAASADQDAQQARCKRMPPGP